MADDSDAQAHLDQQIHAADIAGKSVAQTLVQAGVKFHVEEWDVMAKEPDNPPEWLCQDLLPEGSMAMVSAYPKMGKSTLIYSMLAHIARGDDFLGKATKQVKILLLALDGEHRDLVKGRFRDFNTPTNGMVFVAIDHRFRLETTKKLQEVRHEIKTREIQLLVVDTLSKAWFVEDENDAAQVVRAMAPWRALLDDFSDLTLMLIHHDGKGSGRGAKGIRGSSAIFAEVDQTIQLDKPRGADPRTRARNLTTESRYGLPIDMIVEYDPDLKIYMYQQKSTASIGLMSRIVDVLSINDQQSIASIAQSVGVTGQGVQKVIQFAPTTVVEVTRGMGQGRPKLYSLTEEAKERYDELGDASKLLDEYA